MSGPSIELTQADIVMAHRREHGDTTLGAMAAHAWDADPKRFAFTASRYKFVAKMLEGRGSVLEIGCADAFFSRIVRQSVGELVATDNDPFFVANVKARANGAWPIGCIVHDILTGPVLDEFDAAFALDVLEHIAPAREAVFVDNVARSLGPHGVAIIGMPSLESQRYASEISKAGHVNCKTAAGLKSLMQCAFRNVFMFSMNDEVVHTGFSSMAHYLIALCTDKIER